MYIRVKVLAGAKKESFEKVSETEFKVSVREPAERNLANRKILSLFKDFNSPKRVIIKIISGHHSPLKILSVDEVK